MDHRNIEQASEAAQIEFRRREDLARSAEFKIQPLWKQADALSVALLNAKRGRGRFLEACGLFIGAAFRWYGQDQGAEWAATVGLVIIGLAGFSIIANVVHTYTLQRDKEALERAISDCIGDWIAAGGTISQLAKRRDLAAKVAEAQSRASQTEMDEHWQAVRQALFVRAGASLEAELK